MNNEETGHKENHGHIECEICGAILDFESGKTLVPSDSNAYELNGMKKKILEQNSYIQELENDNKRFIEELKNERKSRKVAVPDKEESTGEPEKKSTKDPGEGSGLYF